MAQTFVCPYCFAESEKSRVEFRCQGRKKCNLKEPDVKQQKYQGLPNPPVGPAYFTAADARGGGFPAAANCPGCYTESRVRVCPHCHNVLPTTIDTDDQIIISLIGTRSSGKSNYVGVLIKELQKRIMLQFDATFRLMGDEDRREYRDQFGNYLYPQVGEPTTIPQTESTIDTRNTAFRRPILGTVVTERKKFFKTVRHAVTLVFYDSAGEDFESEEALEVVSRYLAHSKGIIFLVDPLTQRTILNHVDSQKAESSGGLEVGTVAEPTDVINRVVDIIRAQKGLPESKKINAPTAVAFSKLDVLQDILPPGATLTKPSRHVAEGSFIPSDAAAVDEEIRGLLAYWDAEDLVATVDQSFTDVRFMAFSALGRAPKPDGTIDPPVPVRIEDAILWILSTQGIIPTQKSRR